jgi:hypothetical protein
LQLLKRIKRGARGLIHDLPLGRKLWAYYRGRKQEQAIRAEIADYRRRAEMRGIPSELPADQLARRLGTRLEGRGISPRPKGELEILYLTPLSNWERHNIPPALEKFGRLRTYYVADSDFAPQADDWLEHRADFERDLLSFVRRAHAERPVDVVVSYLSGWFVSCEAIQAINDLGCVTCAFWWDDRPSFRGKFAGGRYAGAKPLASAYDLNLTSSPDSIVKYLVEDGLAMFWPEGANPQHFSPRQRDFEYDVSFVGACYGLRPVYIEHLRKNGIAVRTFGPGWPSGPVPADEMPEIYAKSRINLGFGGIGYSMNEMCLKGRDFEVPMCGALYLTSEHEPLHRVWDVGNEIATYDDIDDCLTQVRTLLADPERCERMRRAAHERAHREHTWERRFEQAFEQLGVLDSSTGNSKEKV